MTYKILIVVFIQLASFQMLFSQNIPYSTNNTHLTIWNGSEYLPFFMKGVNLGVAVPGTFPGEMAASRSDYSRWFSQIKEAGFNCIRLYTLHYPRFYEVLDSFNLANPQNPLLIIQGVWLEEELSGYNHDLFFLTDFFKLEIEENIDCVHGNRNIPPRLGKAHGDFTVDVSDWCLAFIIGREVYPIEVLTTNSNNPSVNSFFGNHFSISSASASEVWFTNMLDYTVDYQNINYNTQRPVSNSSWPTLDPITHPEEPNIEEDTASLDLSKIQIVNAPAGLFISYHAYPYYPDFVSQQSNYQLYSDNYGPNSYEGYLTELKSHYTQYPLIIAEYGVPSSWAIAHYATSGMNHGGFDEYNQGLTNLRMLNTIKDVGCGGGIQFAWIDEWFKKTWITDPIDYIAESRILWHNVAAAEQNYGLVSYEKTLYNDTIIPLNNESQITYANYKVDYSFFQLEIGLKNPLDLPDQLWVCFDTYSEDLGESILPNGDTIPTRSEFALHITNYSAQLLVTEAYDIFGIWHNFSEPEQLYHSIPTDGAPWNIVRVRNNSSHSDVQYIGNMQVNYGFQPESSKDAITIYDDKIIIKIPWFYLNVVAPDQMKVFNDNRNTSEKEDTISDGFAISVKYKNTWHIGQQRILWVPWVNIADSNVNENLKASYFVMKDHLHLHNTQAIAVRDSFYFNSEIYPINIPASDGLLKNDFDLDGHNMIALIVEPPSNGHINLNNDGSFEYYPFQSFNGIDSLKYCIYDGYSLSVPNVVFFNIEGNNSIEVLSTFNEIISIFPNPFNSYVTIKSAIPFSEISLFDLNGKCLKKNEHKGNIKNIDLSDLIAGTYLMVIKFDDSYQSIKVIKQE